MKIWNCSVFQHCRKCAAWKNWVTVSRSEMKIVEQEMVIQFLCHYHRFTFILRCSIFDMESFVGGKIFILKKKKKKIVQCFEVMQCETSSSKN